MIRRGLVLGVVALLFAGTAGATGQVPAPMPANVCVTELGWCDLPITTPLGYACVCRTAENAEVPGVTRAYAHPGPRSPYLRPHTRGTAPALVR